MGRLAMRPSAVTLPSVKASKTAASSRLSPSSSASNFSVLRLSSSVYWL